MTTKIRLLHDTVGIPTGAVAVTQSASDNTTKVATTAYVTTALANLADSAPSTLNTLNELAAALGDDANFSTTVTNSIATKLPLAGGTLTGNLIIDTSAAGAAVLGLERTGAANQWKIAQGHTATDYLEILEGSNVRLTIKNGGNVGIGTADTYSRKFVVQGAGDLMMLRSTNTGTGGAQLDFIHDSSSAATGDSVGIINFSDDAKQYASLKGVTNNINVSGQLHFGVRTDASNYNHEAMVIDNTGNVGIGTTTPQHELVVASTGNTTLGLVGSGYNDAIAIRFGGGDLTNALGNGNSGAAIISQQAVVGGQAKGDLGFQINTGDQLDTAMFISNAGNVGIGTTPVAHYTGYKALDIGTAMSLFSNSGSTNVATMTNNGYLNSGASQWTYKVADEATMYSQVHGDHRFSTAASGSAGGAITWSEKVRITADGNVGIGAPSPGTGSSSLTTLTVDGAIMTTNSSTAGIVYCYEQRFNGSNNLTLGYKTNGSTHTAAQIAAQNNLGLTFVTQGSEKMNIGNYVVPKMNFHYANNNIYVVNTTGDEHSSSAGIMILKQQISVSAGSKIIVWYDSGQILNNNQGGNGSTNSNPQIAVYVSTNSSAPSRGSANMINNNTDHYLYPAGNIGSARIKMNGMGATGTLSTAGTYYIYIYGGSYNSGQYTFNYQNSSGNTRGSSIIWAEIIA